MRLGKQMRCLACWLASVLASAGFAHAETEVDLELVLAVDVSRSMDVDELHFQRDGYVAAFRHPEVLKAIRSGSLGRIAVTYVEWAGPENQLTRLPWTLIDSDGAGRGLASRLATAPMGRYSGTSISGGLLFAAATFANNGYAGTRRVIDVSGDGPNNKGLPVHPISTGITGSGITINGLPLVVKVASGSYSIDNLDIYYEDCVIGGPGAFVIPVHDMSQLGLAIRRKLMLEIAGWQPQPIPASETSRRARIDCLIGERLIERLLGEVNAADYGPRIRSGTMRRCLVMANVWKESWPWKTILRVVRAQDESNRRPFAHERFAKAANSILLLCADNCFQRFHTARVNPRRRGVAPARQVYLQERKCRPVGAGVTLAMRARAQQTTAD